MLPLTHAILILIFVILLKIFTSLTLFPLFIILLAAIFIDIDHWLVYVIKKKDFSITKAYKWFVYLSNLKKKPTFLCIFHTIEFLIIIILLSAKYSIFQFVLIGVFFHFILDIASSIQEKEYLKEISLIYSIIKQFKK